MTPKERIREILLDMESVNAVGDGRFDEPVQAILDLFDELIGEDEEGQSIADQAINLYKAELKNKLRSE